jgi:hypothetical protein
MVRIPSNFKTPCDIAIISGKFLVYFLFEKARAKIEENVERRTTTPKISLKYFFI